MGSSKVPKWWRPKEPADWELFDRTRQNIRTCLAAQGEGIEIYSFGRRYYALSKEDLPVTKLGFCSLGELLFHCDDIVDVRAKPGGRLYLYNKDETGIRSEEQYEMYQGRECVTSSVLLNVFSIVPDAPFGAKKRVLTDNMNVSNTAKKKTEAKAPTMQFYVPPRRRIKSESNNGNENEIHGHCASADKRAVLWRSTTVSNQTSQLAAKFSADFTSSCTTLMQRPSRQPRFPGDGWTLTWKQAQDGNFLCSNEQSMFLEQPNDKQLNEDIEMDYAVTSGCERRERRSDISAQVRGMKMETKATVKVAGFASAVNVDGNACIHAGPGQRTPVMSIATEKISAYPAHKSAIFLGTDVYGHILVCLPRYGDTLEEEIKAFFGENSAKENFRLKAAEIVVGMIAICFTKTRISRVRVGSTKDARNVYLVRDIDKHESFVVSVQDLYYPPPEFLRTPAKAIKCVLKGLESAMYTGGLQFAISQANLRRMKAGIDVHRSVHPFFLVPSVSLTIEGVNLMNSIRGTAGPSSGCALPKENDLYLPTHEQKKIRNFLLQSGELSFGLGSFIVLRGT